MNFKYIKLEKESIEIKATLGAYINYAIEEAITLAKMLNTTVKLKFNDKEIICSAYSKVEDKVKEFFTKE